MTLIFIGALVGMNKLLDVEKIKSNWPEYRCRPDVMIMAGLYGHDAGENIEFCLNNGFQERAKTAMGPFYSFLMQFVKILVTLLASINSIRMIFATIVGSVTQIFSEFSTRIKAFMYRIQATAMRVKWLMGRVFASMYGVLYMGMSGMKAVTNFSNTFLFKFLDTFCFDPDTLIHTARGVIPIREVVIGDVLVEDGSKVTATFSFYSDGQDMVTLPSSSGAPILVSTNHYMLHEGSWIHTADHPNASPAEPWSGGIDRPLICLNTDTHQFKLGGYIFRDYDETEEGDYDTMYSVLEQLNGKPSDINVKEYSCCVHEATRLKTASGVKQAKDIVLGEALSHGQVVGVIKKEVSESCFIQGTSFAPGTAVWCEASNSWKRAGDLALLQSTPDTFYSFVVSPSACLETEAGLVFRDYVEIHSPDTEQAYSNALTKD